MAIRQKAMDQKKVPFMGRDNAALEGESTDKDPLLIAYLFYCTFRRCLYWNLLFSTPEKDSSKAKRQKAAIVIVEQLRLQQKGNFDDRIAIRYQHRIKTPPYYPHILRTRPRNK